MDSFSWYQQEASKTINFDLDHKEQVINMVFGLCGEAGEIADRFKKEYFQGHDPDRAKVLEELGDAMWYIAGQATVHGFSLAEIAEFNIAKLRGRYPNGFNPNDSINRKR